MAPFQGEMSRASMLPSVGSIKCDRHTLQPWLMIPSVHTCVCSRAVLIKNRQQCFLGWNWYGWLVLFILCWFFFQAFFSQLWLTNDITLFLVTPSVTWVALTNWPIMGNIPELLVNNRPMITLRLSCLWWPERNILKVGRLLAQSCVCVCS